MARKVLLSSHVSALMKDFYESEAEFIYGLVLGHFDSKDVMVVHLARTPIEGSEDEESDSKLIKKLKDIDESWFAEHVNQVQNMLPGGIDIQGMFVVTSKDNPFNNKNKIMACLDKVKKSSTNWSVFHLNPKNQECMIQNMPTGKSVSFEVTELKWVALKTTLILDQPLAFTSDGPLKQKLDAAVGRLEQTLEQSVMLINGKSMGNEEVLIPLKAKESSKKAVGKKASKETCSEISCDDDTDGGNEFRSIKDFEVDILFGEKCSDLQETVVSEVCAKMRIMGRMSARAFVSPQVSVETALKYLKLDILRTFKARLEMHCDSLVGEETAGTDVELPILHEPPRRVNIRLPASPITVSDFLFPGETPEESVKAVEEMLGFTPDFEHLDDELEIVASPQTIRVNNNFSFTQSFQSDFSSLLCRWRMTQSLVLKVRYWRLQRLKTIVAPSKLFCLYWLF